MEELALLGYVAGLERAYHRQAVRRLLLLGVKSGLIGSCVLVFILKISGHANPVLLAGLLPLLVGLLAAAIRAFMLKPSAAQVVMAAERRLPLHERLSTALEGLTGTGKHTTLSTAQLRDTARAVRSLDPKSAFPLPRLVRQRALGAWLLLLVILFLFMPTLNWLVPPGRAAELGLLRQEAARLQALADELEKPDPQLTAAQARQRKELARQIREIGREMRRPDTTITESYRKISALSDRLAKEQQAAARRDEFLQGLRNIGDEAPGTGSGTATPASETASRLEELARKISSGALTAKERKQLARKLARLAEGLPAGDPTASRLRQAAEALEKNDKSAAAQKLREAARQASKEGQGTDSGGAQQAMDQLARAGSNLGGNGQAGGQGQGNGTGNPQGNGQAGQGQGQGQGTSSGQSQGPPGMTRPGPGGNAGYNLKPGTGNAQPDYGVGTTQGDTGPSKPTQPRQYVIDRQSGHTSTWTTYYQRLYQEERHRSRTFDYQAQGKPGIGPVQDTTPVRGAPEGLDSAQRAEGEVYLDYRARAEEAVEREEIPPAYQDLVRRYFTDIDPRGEANTGK